MDKLEYIRFLTGDIVYIHGSVRVISSCDGYYATYYDENETLQEVNVNVIEGISLTPEILLKKGWMLYHLYYWFTEEECLKLRLLKLDKRPWNAYIGSNLMRVNIHSVSDLQHLLFGLGLNSEMEV